MKSLLFLSLLAFAAAGFLELKPTTENTGSNCDATLVAFDVSTFLIDPWPLARNENVIMNYTGTFTTAETLNALVVNVQYQKVPFYQLVLDRNGTYTKGTQYSDYYKAFFPTIAPPGDYVVWLQLRNEANEYLNCWGVDFTL